MSRFLITSAAFFLSAAIAAQTPAFEVASVKLNRTGQGPFVLPIQPGGRVTLQYRTLRSLVQFAYSPIDSPLQESQIVGGPDWVDADHFDIVAKMEGDPAPGRATAELVRMMVRTLLAQRFNAKLHTEIREIPVYALVLARNDGTLASGLRRRSELNCDWFKPGPGLPDPRGSAPLCGLLGGGQGRLNSRGITMAQLARALAPARLDRIVTDSTGLSGLYDVDLEWGVNSAAPIPPAPASNDAPSIFTAVQEQLGLKLEPRRGPVDVLVIDRIEPPTPD
jgi:uncharacterized protein (TIGR03435 family)